MFVDGGGDFGVVGVVDGGGGRRRRRGVLWEEKLRRCWGLVVVRYIY